jgi:hypothetical protein
MTRRGKAPCDSWPTTQVISVLYGAVASKDSLAIVVLVSIGAQSVQCLREGHGNSILRPQRLLQFQSPFNQLATAFGAFFRAFESWNTNQR